MGNTIEAKAAETILQQPETVVVGGNTYSVAPPSIATLILVSEAVSRLPHIVLDDKRVLEESIAIAKDCELIGDIVAILILGAKHVNDLSETVCGKRRWWNPFSRRKALLTRQEALKRELLTELTPRELQNTASRILLKMQVGDFFGLTTFLTGINMMRPTKVVTEQTASGQ